MSSATVTPSLVILGDLQPLSSTAFRPRGPSVLPTALASFATPAASGCRASSSNTICFATDIVSWVQMFIFLSSVAALALAGFRYTATAFGRRSHKPPLEKQPACRRWAIGLNAHEK